MRELIYTLLELEWEFRNRTCDFCSNPHGEDNKGVNQIRTRSKLTNKLVANDIVCEECKEKFLNDEMPKCDRCGRLQNEMSANILCRCIRNNENLEEKELPSLPHERESMTTFYERQINSLQEEKNQLTEEVDTHLEALEISEVWNKRQKEELVEEINKLKEKNKKLEEEIEKLLAEELVQKVKLYEKEIDGLKKQLEHFQQQNAQIETPPKDKGIIRLFKFGGKK